MDDHQECANVSDAFTAVNKLTLNADRFLKCFNDKLLVIASNIAAELINVSPPSVPLLPNTGQSFQSFSCVSPAQVNTLLTTLNKPSSVDVIPIFLIKACHYSFSILIAKLATLSFAIFIAIIINYYFYLLFFTLFLAIFRSW
jgi:hypothetical protein